MSIFRSGVTLLETIVAATILVAATVMVIQALASTTEIAAVQEADDDLAEDLDAIIEVIGEDLARSAWEFPSFTRTDYNTSVYSADRGLIYYPYVVQQCPTDGLSLAEGLPSQNNGHAQDASMVGIDFAHVIRDPSMVLLWQGVDGVDWQGAASWAPPQPMRSMPGVIDDFRRRFDGDTSLGSTAEQDRRYRESFYARSQELIFLRANIDDEAWEADPNSSRQPMLYFDGDSADWTPPSDADIDNLVNNVYYPIRLAEVPGRTASEALALAHEDVLSNDFRHENIGVLRMSETGLHGTDTDNDGRLEFDNGEVAPRERAGAPAHLRFIDNLISPGAWLALDQDNTATVKVRWETCVDTDTVEVTEDVATGLANERIRTDHLREFTYAVIPSPLGGAGRLVRAYSVLRNDVNGDGSVDAPGSLPDLGPEIGNLLSEDADRAFIIDEVLSDHVARIVFDTYRTTPTAELDMNEVRMRIYMARNFAQGDARDQAREIKVFREVVFAMRAGNNQRQNQENLDILNEQRVRLER